MEQINNNLKDYSTTLYNKNYLIKNQKKIAKKIIKDFIKGKYWAVLFCDINGLKLVNDTIGHVEADKGIKYIAAIIKKNIRTKRKNSDTLIRFKKITTSNNIDIRFGGDEFLILMPDCNRRNGVKVADRIKKEILLNKVKAKDLTLSIGVSDTSELIDRMNFKSKREQARIIDDLIVLAENRMSIDKNKDVDSLSYEEQKHIFTKHLNRMSDQLGINMFSTDKIDILIDILKDIKKMKN